MPHSDVPAPYTTTYYEVVQRELDSAETLVAVAIREQWPTVELERIQERLILLHHNLQDCINDRDEEPRD